MSYGYLGNLFHQNTITLSLVTMSRPLCLNEKYLGLSIMRADIIVARTDIAFAMLMMLHTLFYRA